MKTITNTATQRVIDLLGPYLKHGNQLDCATPSLSLYAFAAIREALFELERVRLIVPPDNKALKLSGTDSDRSARNRLQSRWLANQCARWIQEKVTLRQAMGEIPQGVAVIRNNNDTPEQAVLGSNDRVLVLAPKRLRDNWALYKANDKRNILAADRFNYDILNHTDLSRDGGMSGDIDLSHVNWGNYDLVVIDESHNFRNKATHKDKESRYDRLMRRIIREGVKTRVLMLSATPVNNRLTDLRNQIAFATEGDDTALAAHGIASIEATTRKAQRQFNRWLELDDADKTPARLVEMLGFDYFTLLDHLTIARSRRHVEKYYGTGETGRFPDRLPPINIKADVDLHGE